jgi:hypothetical protein
MSEQKKKAGRPPKIGAKAILGYAKTLLPEVGADQPMLTADEAKEADYVVWCLDHNDLFNKYPNLLDLIDAHTELKMFFDLRIQLGTTSMLARKMLDAALRTGIEEVMQGKRRKTSIESSVAKRKTAALAIAKGLKDQNDGKLPKKYLIKIAFAMQLEFGEVSESTIRRYLEE